MIKQYLFPWFSAVHNSLNYVKKPRSDRDLMFRGRSKNGLEAKNLRAQNSATGGHRRLRFLMNKFFIRSLDMPSLIKIGDGHWNEQLAEIDQFWPGCDLSIQAFCQSWPPRSISICPLSGSLEEKERCSSKSSSSQQTRFSPYFCQTPISDGDTHSSL